MKSERYAARLAGFTFLFLIACVLASTFLFGEAGNEDVGGALRYISENTMPVRVGVYLQVIASISTFVLGGMLYAITKHQDQNLAIIALSFRAAEAALYVIGIMSVLGLLSLSQETVGASELATAEFVSNAWSLSTNIGATFFAVGSTVFSYLLFKARSIPVLLSLLGLVASFILVVVVPIQAAAGYATGEGVAFLIWIPMFLFEISAGFWLLIKGTRPA
jgi:Domain of unknown function (DUF4386)